MARAILHDIPNFTEINIIIPLSVDGTMIRTVLFLTGNTTIYIISINHSKKHGGICIGAMPVQRI